MARERAAVEAARLRRREERQGQEVTVLGLRRDAGGCARCKDAGAHELQLVQRLYTRRIDDGAVALEDDVGAAADAKEDAVGRAVGSALAAARLLVVEDDDRGAEDVRDDAAQVGRSP